MKLRLQDQRNLSLDGRCWSHWRVSGKTFHQCQLSTLEVFLLLRLDGKRPKCCFSWHPAAHRALFLCSSWWRQRSGCSSSSDSWVIDLFDHYCPFLNHSSSRSTSAHHVRPVYTRCPRHTHIVWVLTVCVKVCYRVFDVFLQATYRPFLRQILEEVFHPDRLECPDIEHMSGGLTDLLKTGFSMFMKVSRRSHSLSQLECNGVSSVTSS